VGGLPAVGGFRVKVLVACEFSGIVRDAFIARGHDAISCDLLPTERPGPHYQGDVFDIVNDGFDLMIAHPPCTHLAVAGAPSFKNKIADGRQQTALEFVRQLLTVPIYKIALENPISIISSKIRKPDQIIQPYFFGDAHVKKTCLWLKNLPPLQYDLEDNLFAIKTATDPEYKIYKSKKSKTGFSKYPMAWSGKRDWKLRSSFWPSIAKAMAEQWG
jgi:site-specific DNA-cytosine methylase